MLNTTITYCTYVTHARVNLKIVCVGGWVVSNKCPPPIPRTWGSPRLSLQARFIHSRAG